jgi:hypothetical protein
VYKLIGTPDIGRTGLRARASSGGITAVSLHGTPTLRSAIDAASMNRVQHQTAAYDAMAAFPTVSGENATAWGTAVEVQGLS